MTDTLNEQLQKLGGPRDYHAQLIPSALDESLLRLFCNLSVEEIRQERVRIAKFHPQFSDFPGIFGLRMATLSVRRQEPNLAAIGLKAFISVRGSRDLRDDTIVVSLFFDALRRSGGSPEITFSKVALESPADRELLEGFLARSERDRSIEVMGYRVEGAGETFRYVYQK